MTIDELAAYGVDVESGLARCMGNEAFYLRMVERIRNEEKFDALAAAIDAGDLEAAFKAAHALKGVLGNLSLTPLYDPVCEIVEPLRRGEQMDYAPLMAKIEAARAGLPC